MKREDVKAHIPGITDEGLNWLLDTTGAELTRERAKADALQKQLDTANGQLQTVQEQLKAFDGKDVAGLEAQVAKLTQDIKDQADGFAFDAALDGAIRDAKGRSVKAVRGMLDLDALKASKDRSADIKAAIDGLVKESPWAFDTAPAGGDGGAGGKPSATFSTGGEHGTGGSAGPTDGVAAAFASLNPDLKL